VIKRGAVIGIGTVFLVIGFGGLALLQTGVINPPSSISPVNLSEVNPSAPALQSAQAPTPPVAESTPSVPQAPASRDMGRSRPVPVPQIGKGERRYPGQDQPWPGVSVLKQQGTREKHGLAARKTESKHYARKAKSKSYARKTEPKSYTRKTSSKTYARNAKSERYAHKSPPPRFRKGWERPAPVVIRFRFDPARNRELYVARVHSGDEIKVKVQRVGQVDRRVYFTYTRGIDSKNGALVKATAAYPPFGPVGFYERGYYVIEMTIYPGNRWNIKPRSFV
jgi:hypothetical protein